ncbi:MAG: hypothetical protein ACTHLA_11770 [Asticcacaulis sp.]|uniref:hypothetical protein n=1 Tax=Asticcacaulis sp. TaxID=1872648 RepID=UPI003F7B3FC4
MTAIIYHLIDNNTGEEVFASEDFAFVDPPVPNHIIRDEVLHERYGSPAIVDRVENLPGGEVNVYIDGWEEVTNQDALDTDPSYRRS